MKKLFAFACLVTFASLVFAASPARKPKLVVAIAVDQFRYDYLTRFRTEYTGGFDQLLTQGAVFTDAHYIHFPTVTAVGHSTFLSGATPSLSGIIGNEWYDRETGKTVTSVSDPTVQLLGGTGSGSSPRRLLVSTVGDEMKIADHGKSRVIGVSLKDRSAILPSGHMADGAFWFDTHNGNFVSSAYYFQELPAWVRDFDAGHPADRYEGARFGGKTFPSEAGPKLYAALPASPFGNELIEAFAERAIDAEQLGQRDATDLLTISFSSNDYVGHAYGPDSPQVHEISVATDRIIGKLFRFLDSKVGMQNVLIVLTGDHGVAPVPEVNEQRKMSGGRIPEQTVLNAIQTALVQKYGEGKWITSPAETCVYLNLELIRQKHLSRADVDRTAAQAVYALPHIFRVFTREQLMSGAVPDDIVGRDVINGFYPTRGGDVYVLLDPYWIFSPRGRSTGTTHGTIFGYDTHVPIIFMGPGIKPGRYYQSVAPNDIAPTLATMLNVEIPSGSVGRVLAEMLTD